MTAHASKRSQQRSVPPLIVTWLLDYGADAPAADGASLRYFDKRSRRDLERECGRQVIDRLDAWFNCYLIEFHGTVITMGRRYKHIKK
ncbi:MAG: hypothetical protein ACYS8I_00655 [Planctomycetota bacterium]